MATAVVLRPLPAPPRDTKSTPQAEQASPLSRAAGCGPVSRCPRHLARGLAKLLGLGLRRILLARVVRLTWSSYAPRSVSLPSPPRTPHPSLFTPLSSLSILSFSLTLARANHPPSSMNQQPPRTKHNHEARNPNLEHTHTRTNMRVWRTRKKTSA